MKPGDFMWVAVAGEGTKPFVHEVVVEYASPSSTEVVYKLWFADGMGSGTLHTRPATELFFSRADALAWIAATYRQRAQALLDAADACEPRLQEAAS